MVSGLKFLPFQGAPQASFHGLSLDRPNIHLRLEEPIALTAIFLGLVHRGVGVLMISLLAVGVVMAVVGFAELAN